MKHAGGRPKGSTKYSNELPDKIRAYVEECLSKSRIPWIEEFCYKNNVGRRSFYNWLKEYEELAESREDLMMIQEMMLKQVGISSKGSTSMCIFLLKTSHGYIETERLQHIGSNEEPLTLIFTDSETFKKHEENRKRLESQNTKKPITAGRHDWTNYSQNPLTT